MRWPVALISLFLLACRPTARAPVPATPPAAGFITRLDGTRLSLAEVDRSVRATMDAGQVVGLALAIINDGRVVHQKAYGWRDVVAKLPLGEATIMYGASFTKAAFAYLVMQLVDERIIDLDLPIQRYLARPLGQYDKYRDLAGDPRAASLTARMLLSHTSGFPNYRSYMPDQRLRIYFTPGSRYAYSGEGINLLQLVIEEVTGRPLADLMQERVFRRFDMARTSMVWQAGFAGDVAVGHGAEGQPLGHDQRARARAAGSMDTTVADYARFLVGVLRGEGLSAASRREMFAPQIAIHSRRQFPSLSSETTDENRAIKLAYGLGWGRFDSRHGPAFFKEGHEDGWENHAVCFEQPRTCLLLMSNSENGERIFLPLLQTLLADQDTPWRWEGYIPYNDLASAR